MERSQLKRAHAEDGSDIPLNGSSFLQMVVHYAATLNRQEPFNLENLWEVIARTRYEQALEAALKEYEECFSSQRLPQNDNQVVTLERSAESSFQQAIRQFFVPRQNIVLTTSQERRELILTQFEKRNYRAGKERAASIMQELLEDFDKRGLLHTETMEQQIRILFRRQAATCPSAAIAKVEEKLRQKAEAKVLLHRVRQLEAHIALTSIDSEATDPKEDEYYDDDAMEEPIRETRRTKREGA